MTEARTVTLAIIGGGPAGLAAATKASELGIDAILLDMHPQTGGHYLVSPAVQSDKTASATNLDDDFALRAAAADCHTEIWSETVVWGLYKESPFLLTLDGEGGRQLRARYVIVSAGAYDRPVPFPGWTLPGVMTAGAVQVLLKSQRVLPGQRFLLAGTGPLQLSVAAHLAAAGADIAAMLELRGLSMLLGNWRYAPVLLGQGKRMAEGWQYLRAMRQAHTPVRLGWTILRAEGDGQVERAIIARADHEGKPIAGSEETIDVDTICLGYGLLPSTELCSAVGCDAVFDYVAGVWRPERDAFGQTSIPGLYVAGDGGQIAGKDAAMLEGALAVLDVAKRLGSANETHVAERSQALLGKLARERHFARFLDHAFGPLPGLWELIDDDTVLCRCENVTLADVKRAVAGGATSFADVKAQTRASMGRCQGRMCQSSIAQAIARELGCALDEASKYSSHQPVFPVTLENLQHTDQTQAPQA